MPFSRRQLGAPGEERDPEAFYQQTLYTLTIDTTLKILGLAVSAFGAYVAWRGLTRARHRWFAKRIGATYRQKEMRDCEILTIDDVMVRKGILGTVRFDVRFRNKGQVTANVTRLALLVTERHPTAGLVKPSAYYGLRVTDDENLIDIAHVLEPGKVDNIVLRASFPKSNRGCFFRGRIALYYNGDCLTESGDIEFDSV